MSRDEHDPIGDIRRLMPSIVEQPYRPDDGLAGVVSRDEAVKAAAEALRAYDDPSGRYIETDAFLGDAAAAVDAVWPVIERAVRAQAAAEVRAACTWPVSRDHDLRNEGRRDAARIVEGQP